MDEENEVLDLTNEVDEGVQEQEDEQQGDDEIVIEFDGAPAEEEPPLVKKLRQEIRERDRRLAERTHPQEEEIVVGDYPTIEECEYDDDKHRDAVQKWVERGRAAEAQKASRKSAEDQRAAEFRDLEIRYRADAAKLPVKQEVFDEADRTVRAALPDAVQIAIAKYMDNPAKVVLALGTHPAKLDAIAAEPDPVKQLFMIRDLQGAIKVTTRRAAPAPEAETIQRGSASMSQAVDKQAEKLLAEGMKSGNMTQYNRYMKSKKRAA